MMTFKDVTENAKKHPALYGGVAVVCVVIFIVIVRGGKSSSQAQTTQTAAAQGVSASSLQPSSAYYQAQASEQATTEQGSIAKAESDNQVSIAQIQANAATSQAQINSDGSVAIAKDQDATKVTLGQQGVTTAQSQDAAQIALGQQGVDIAKVKANAAVSENATNNETVRQQQTYTHDLGSQNISLQGQKLSDATALAQTQESDNYALSHQQIQAGLASQAINSQTQSYLSLHHHQRTNQFGNQSAALSSIINSVGN